MANNCNNGIAWQYTHVVIISKCLTPNAAWYDKLTKHSNILLRMAQSLTSISLTFKQQFTADQKLAISHVVLNLSTPICVFFFYIQQHNEKLFGLDHASMS